MTRRFGGPRGTQTIEATVRESGRDNLSKINSFIYDLPEYIAEKLENWVDTCGKTP